MAGHVLPASEVELVSGGVIRTVQSTRVHEYYIVAKLYMACLFPVAHKQHAFVCFSMKWGYPVSGVVAAVMSHGVIVRHRKALLRRCKH